MPKLSRPVADITPADEEHFFETCAALINHRVDACYNEDNRLKPLRLLPRPVLFFVKHVKVKQEKIHAGRGIYGNIADVLDYDIADKGPILAIIGPSVEAMAKRREAEAEADRERTSLGFTPEARRRHLEESVSLESPGAKIVWPSSAVKV